MLFGLGQAASERYTTPSVMAWAALMIIVFSYVRCIGLRGWRFGGLFLFIASIMLLVFQSSAVRVNHLAVFERKVGALSATLGVGDTLFIKELFPSVEYVLAISQKIEKYKYGFANVFPFAGNAQAIGKKIHIDTRRSCSAAVDQLDAIPMGNGYLRLVGWALDAQNQRVPEKLMVLDANDMVIGFALTGKPRKDLLQIFGNYAKRAGFAGYIQASAQGQSVRFVTTDGDCVMHVNLPKLMFERFEGFGKIPLTLTSAALISNEHYSGTSNIVADTAPGATIYSSYVNGDGDVGSIKLHIRNGDVLMFKTGPVSARQLLKSDLGTVALPLSGEWSTLRFVGFPDEEIHEITIQDAGDGWGEWSAIALRNQQ